MSSRRRRRQVAEEEEEEEPEEEQLSADERADNEEEDDGFDEDLDEDEKNYQRAVGGFRPGSIRRIKLENFLTYSEAEFCPGPRLNMIVGANGTGKSSILNAICLGLGGEPKHLGRADDARAFIQHGQDVALIEIELEPIDDSTPCIFRRVIDRNKGSERGRGRGASTFFLNNDKVKMEDIHSVVRDQYNIDLSNLCTFLPQDKVGSFSGLTQQDLLLETEKTLSGSQHLYKTHQELIQAEHELRTQVGQAGAVSALETKLNEVQEEVQELGRAKEKMEERKQALKELELLKVKHLWLEVDALMTEAVELRDKKKEFKAKLKQASANLQPLKDKEAEYGEQRQAVEHEIQKCTNDQKAARDKMEKQETKYNHHDEKVEELIALSNEIDGRRDEIIKKINLQETKISKYADNLAGLDHSPEELQQELQKAKAVAQETHKARREIDTKLRDLERSMNVHEEQAQTIQGQLAKQTDAKRQRQKQVFQKFPQCQQICEIISRRRQDFNKPVLGPVASLVVPKNGTQQQHAAFLEQHVSSAIWKAFIVETKHDQDLLYRLVREERNISINVILVDRVDEFHRPYNDGRLRLFKERYGITGYLDELYDGPDTVMQALRTQSKIHHVLVGDQKTQRAMDSEGLLDILSQRDSPTADGKTLQNYVACCHDAVRLYKYQTSISDYSGAPSTRIDNVNKASFMKIISQDGDEVAQDLRRKLEDVQDKIGELRPKVEELRNQKDEEQVKQQDQNNTVRSWSEHLKTVKILLNKRASSEKTLQKLKDELAEFELTAKKEKSVMKGEIQKGVRLSLQAMAQHGKANEGYIRHSQEKVRLLVKSSNVKAAHQRAQGELQDAKDSFSGLERDAVAANEAFKKAKNTLEAKKAKAEEKYPLDDEEGNPLPLKVKVEALDFETAEDVEAAMEDCQQRADVIVDNPEIVRTYERKIQEQKLLEEKLDDAKNFRASKIADIEQKRAPWQSSLQNSIALIDSKFSAYMAEMGNTGGVSLDTGTPDSDGNPANFEKWGIKISVSFRENTKAQVLSARVQSGGERSVSTIMYLMALQDMMVSPFRAVDEINQGLDESNERGVFKRIVQNSCGVPKKGPLDHNGQYFLITPKLLPNLYDMEEEAMTLLFVFNGLHNVKSQSEWNVDAIVKGAAYDEGEERPAKKRRSKEAD
mmetsp:Transcript_97/g.411  ORF Transcript_97/g.411 Transcript_97/m.411 type:complete len:1168 (-) Transcript_97:119-3622(-)|eukprot:CAMPEP_0168747158 /NCGR_PEP_ID=MMETSP0724-20121128/15518_1 /TAXON_ID=265536 /ORGANISM="Amphiprora sp., Strain CCMP467" /LENGTH=1167 /DNA_ID=CAMNT_0008794951 /DNA_START=15 /DNA_END=3518 /DNA_ORIENTATION=-